MNYRLNQSRGRFSENSPLFMLIQVYIGLEVYKCLCCWCKGKEGKLVREGLKKYLVNLSIIHMMDFFDPLVLTPYPLASIILLVILPFGGGKK